MKAPVALIIFNRPSLVQRVLQALRAYRPDRLLVIADGPRSEDEAPLCLSARAVIDGVDWPCDVATNYSDVNLGCNSRVTSGISWAFEQCEEAIILEDDCLPDSTFFQYCADLLERYRYDERVMMINGCNFQFGRQRTPYSYYFSQYPHIWGWATWRRAWRYYNDATQLWPTLRETSWLRDMLSDRDTTSYWRMVFDEVRAGQMTWDYRWNLACWTQHGLAIAPSVNLISNIGFGEGATHATAGAHRYANLSTVPMEFPLRHPPYVLPNGEADRFEFRQEVPSDLYHRMRRALGVVMPMPARHVIIDAERRLRARRQS